MVRINFPFPAFGFSTCKSPFSDHVTQDDSKNPSTALALPDSSSFSTDRLPPITSSSTTSVEEAAADLEIIREEPLDYADEDGDGLYQYDYTDFARFIPKP